MTKIRHSKCVTKSVMSTSLLTPLLKVIVQQYLHMGKQVREKHTLWQEKTRYTAGKFISQTNAKALYPELSKSYGRKSGNTRVNSLSRHPILKFTMNKLRICLISNLEFFIADGIQPMDFLLKTWLLWIVVTSMIWYLCC